jgi:hypothetical protein
MSDKGGKGNYPMVLNRFIRLGKGKKGNYPRFGKKSAHKGSFVFVWSKPYSEYRVIFVKNWFTFLILIFV